MDNDKKSERRRYLADYYVKNKEKIAERKKQLRLAKRDEANAASRERYANDPDFKATRKQIKSNQTKQHQELLSNDPDYKRKHEEKKAKKRALHKERYANDPDYRKKYDDYNAKRRSAYRLKKEENKTPVSD